MDLPRKVLSRKIAVLRRAMGLPAGRPMGWVNLVRIAVGVILAVLAWLQAHWLLLLLSGVLWWQAYRDLQCVICEAGFCEQTKDQS